MSGALRTNTTLTRLIRIPYHTRRRHIPTSTAAKFQTKSYLRSPNATRQLKHNPFLLSSSAAFSSKPSSSATSSSSGFVPWYLNHIKNRPILTKSVTAGVIYTAADLSSQTIVKSEKYDPVRTLRMAAYGVAILGPATHFWFNFMAKTFPKSDMLSTLKKMAMGQGVCGPTMAVVFFSVNALLQGENSGEIFERLKRDLVPTLLTGVMYWPICDFLTFRFFPVHLQTLMNNGFSYLWTIYLTYIASLKKASAVATD